MKTVNLGDAKARLAELVRAVRSGTEPEIVIALDGVPAVRIVAYGNAPRRTLGIDFGLVSWPSDFDEPNKQIAELFGGDAR